MKLSELVQLKNQLDAMPVDSIKQSVDLELTKFTQLVNNIEILVGVNNINQAFDHFTSAVDLVRKNLNNEIVQAERAWFQESYRLHEEEIWRHPTEHILQVCMPDLSTEFNDIIESRLNLYSSWYHAGMLIRPGTSHLINRLVSFDPLYILDRSYDLLSPSVSQFPEQYQQRLRQYTIEDVNNSTYLDKLPNGQFSLCVVYMYFNYKPLEVIKKYFSELFEKLKPGGILAFTFNDCERASAVKLVELHFCCYTPGFLVEQLAQSIGFEIAYKWHNHGAVTWLELRKPGVLTSIKGGQSLGKIVPK